MADAYDSVRAALIEQRAREHAAMRGPQSDDQALVDAAKKSKAWYDDTNRRAEEAARASQAALEAEVARRARDPIDSMNDAQSRAEAIGAGAYNALGARTVSRGPRPFYKETKQYTDTVAPLVDAVPERQAAVDQAQIRQQMVAAEATARMAQEHAAASEAMAMSQQHQAEREANQMARIQRSIELADNATEEFQKQASIDPNAGWASRPLWAKFLAVLSAGMIGFSGRGDPMAHINMVINEGLEAEKSRLQTSKDRVDAAQGRLTRDRSVYQDLLQQTQNEREADLLYKHARLEQARAVMMAQLQTAGVEVLSESQKMTMNALDQEVASLKLQINKTVAANTPYVTTVSRAVSDPDQRAILKAQAMAGVKAPGETAAANVQTLRAREEQDAKARAAASAGPDAATRRVDASQRQFLVQATRLRREELSQLEEWKAKYKNEIPGFVWGLGWTNPKPGEWNPFWGVEEQEAYSSLKRAIMIRLRADSGAAIARDEEAKDSPYGGTNYAGISEAELEAQADRIIGAHQSEEGLMREVDRRIAEARRDIAHVERGVEDSAREHVNRSQAQPFTPRSTGDLPASTETWED